MRYEAFYHTPRWRKKRAAILRRDGYCCQLSKRYGRIVEANTVHHIFPREDFPEFAWEDWNLISVCAEQHNRLEDRTTGDLTEAGRDLLRRTARRRGIEIPEKYRK